MAGDIQALIELQKQLILEDKRRLGIRAEKFIDNERDCVARPPPNSRRQLSVRTPQDDGGDYNVPVIEPLYLNGALKDTKQAFIDRLVNSENSLSFRSDENNTAMLRYGEYSPNNPQLRVTAAPYLGLGEYDQRRKFVLQKQRADYLEHLSQNKKRISFKNCNLVENSRVAAKAIQTDIQNIHSPLVQYDVHSQIPPERELSLPLSNQADQRLSTQNALLIPEMDKPKSILSNRRTGSPRERLMADLKHSYTPSFMDGFSYQDRSEELERERIKRENYQRELRMQIEEKRQLQAIRDEQDRREQELENRRLEQQLMRMHEEQVIEEQRRNRRDEQMRRHSEDLLRRKQELQARHNFRKHTDSESSVSGLRNCNNTSRTTMSHYSPPVSRRNPYSFNIPSTSVFADSRYNPNRFESYYRKDTLNRMDSLNYDTHRFNAFSRYDSLSRIDTLNRQDTLDRIESLNIQDNSCLSNVQRRHSATQQDLSMFKRSPKLQRRSSSSRFEDTLPIPVLKAHSPVAKELKNSIPFNSSKHSSDALRKLEDKWQIPAVQKNIVNHGDGRDGQCRNILTQLGAIRMQLQQEQLRMDETLRKRDFTQSKAVDFH